MTEIAELLPTFETEAQLDAFCTLRTMWDEDECPTWPQVESAMKSWIAKLCLAERERCLAEADHFLSDIQISIDGRSRFDILDINRQAKKAVRYVRDRISGDYEKNWSSVPHPSSPSEMEQTA